MTGSTNCQATHIVPHAKGHLYMTSLAKHRREVLHPPLHDINDTPNGIMLAVQLHASFVPVASEVAFLQTPNFAMSVNDVDLVMQPNADRVGFVIHPSKAEHRLTFQHVSNCDVATATLAPHNSDARVVDSKEWPPPLPFDVAHGCAALRKWGVPRFIDLARGRTKDIYYGIEDNNDDENGKRSKKATRREARRVARNTADPPASDFADMVLGLWMHNAMESQRRAHAMKADRTREQVQVWLDSAKWSTIDLPVTVKLLKVCAQSAIAGGR